MALPFATHSIERVRSGVASAIGVAKDTAAADLLLEMVDDSDLIVRETAVNSLLQLPAAQAAPFWKKLRHHNRYGPLFINALATQNVEPYLNDLVKILNRDVRAERVLNYKLNDVDYKSWQLLFKYISKKPKATLESNSLSHILETLEYTHLMPPTLYRFYRTKKMEKRAKSYLGRLRSSLLKIYDKDFKEIDREFTKR